MNEYLVPALLLTGLTIGCSAAETPNQTPNTSAATDASAGKLELTAQMEAYPFKAAVAEDKKGGGDLGQARRQIAIGEKVVATCVEHAENSKNDHADSVKIGEGEFEGYSVPLYLAPSESPFENQQVFTISAAEIRTALGYCAAGKD